MNCSGVLSSTTDGGATWTNDYPVRAINGALTTDPVTPVNSAPIQMKKIAPLYAPDAAAPPPIGLPSGIDQHPSDSTRTMAWLRKRRKCRHWWYSSPYYDVGIVLAWFAHGLRELLNPPNGVGHRWTRTGLSRSRRRAGASYPSHPGCKFPADAPLQLRRTQATTYPTRNHFGQHYLARCPGRRRARWKRPGRQGSRLCLQAGVRWIHHLYGH